ncbi:MAG: DNA recombination protein RmuC [Rickettsiales bacterium]|jgi:DNA recombination protein RmuC|nr:DNA recombination protein RmuC [Rickettsiales bacterium]
MSPIVISSLLIISFLCIVGAILLVKQASLKTKNQSLSLEIVNLANKLEHEQYKNNELVNLEQNMKINFENMSYNIFKKIKYDLVEDNNKNIDEILAPLKISITSFEKNFKEKHDADLRDRISLKEEVKNLFNLNQKLSSEANNLASAIKGDNKFQGRWGEVILEKLLENSGLRKNSEYFTQVSSTNDRGDIIRPDIVIKLPNQKDIIVDSKVSLNAYDAYCNDQDESHLKQHVSSIKSHINILADKSYHESDMTNYDFVIMFMPIESAYNLVIQHSPDIFWFAWEKKILLTGPLSFHSTLKIVYSTWSNYNINKNAEIIAKESGALYDKFAGLIENLNQAKKAVSNTNDILDNGFKKISGKGGIFSRIDNIKKLGAKSSKIIAFEDESDAA